MNWRAFAVRVEGALLSGEMRGFGASASDDSIAYSHSADLLTLADALGFERIIPAPGTC